MGASAAAITVYADWAGLAAPLRLGSLHARHAAGHDIFEFEFDAAALLHPSVVNLHLDPRIGLFEGRQHPPQGHETFGVFSDASPDRCAMKTTRPLPATTGCVC